MSYHFPFGLTLHPLIQTDQTPKKVFVLGVYASAVHARWTRNGKIICRALAVASEPRIFWDGNEKEAREILSSIPIPPEAGELTPAGEGLNGPSAKVLDEMILAPLGYCRKDTWLCDCLPEARLNAGQMQVIRERYEPIRRQYGLNEVTVPPRPDRFCDEARCREITEELIRSRASLLVLLGDIPIGQYLCRVASLPYSTLGQYVSLYGYGQITTAHIGGKELRILPLAHPRQIGGLGAHSESWKKIHQNWLTQQNQI